MDHYAKADDDLSIALKNKTLHRNFQGYATRKTTGQVYGFGSSSISQLWGSYVQNVKTYPAYIETIEKQGLAPDNAYVLKQEEQITREVITEIMCNGEMDFENVGKRFNKTADQVKGVVQFSPEKLEEFMEDQLVAVDGNKVQVFREGFFIVRNIAMAFDPLLKTTEGMYSKTI